MNEVRRLEKNRHNRLVRAQRTTEHMTRTPKLDGDLAVFELFDFIKPPNLGPEGYLHNLVVLFEALR